MRETLEEQMWEVVCPVCHKVRMVSRSSYLRAQKVPSPCRSCSRKSVRKGMAFRIIECRVCGKPFPRISGATKTCPACKVPPAPKECPVCGTKYIGYANKKACSQACLRRLRVNERYFGGNYFEALGWKEKTCMVCGRHVVKGGSVHHVLRHPNHERLIYLCRGCHELVGTLARRPNINLKMLLLLSLMQHSGHERWTVDADIDEYTEEEWESAQSMGITLEIPTITRE